MQCFKVKLGSDRKSGLTFGLTVVESVSHEIQTSEKGLVNRLDIWSGIRLNRGNPVMSLSQLRPGVARHWDWLR